MFNTTFVLPSSLRISRLTDEMRETEFGEAGDDTFQEMVRDFLR